MLMGCFSVRPPAAFHPVTLQCPWEEDALSPGPASTRGAGVLSRISHPSVLTFQPPGPMHTHSGLNVLDRKCGKHTKHIESKMMNPGG